MKESVVETYLCRQVRRAGGEVRKVKFLGHDGAPDRLVLLPQQIYQAGKTFWVELKSPVGKLRAAQVREHAKLRALGQYVYTIRTKEEVDECLSLF